MTFKSNLSGLGTPAAVASAIVGGVANSLTATGSAQGDAYALGMISHNVFTTTASSTGAKLNANMSMGDVCTVANYGAQTLSVYPPGTGKIQNGSASAAFSVAANKVAKFISIDGGTNGSFIAVLSA